LAIAGATAAVWLLISLFGLQQAAVLWGAFIPVRIGGGIDSPWLAPVFLTPLTSAFLHVDLMHLLFNLLMLLFCGRAVEGILGPLGIVILYLIGAYLAAAGQYVLDPMGAVPMIGASGAGSAVLGAYAMLFGRNKLRVKDPRLAIALHALWLLAAWVVLQLIIGLATQRLNIAIAVGAHIGGFVAGVALARPLLLLRWRGA
jgi:membrane associated rhomboid family serine protease